MPMIHALPMFTLFREFCKGKLRFGSILLLVAILGSVVSCTPANFIRPSLEPEGLLTGSPSYAVVLESYVKGFDSPTRSGAVVTVLRGGDIAKIVSRGKEINTTSDNPSTWLLLDNGVTSVWVAPEQVQTCDRELQAKYLSQRVTHDLFK